MRIVSGSTSQYINFVAVDATDLKTRETGLTGFTVYRSRNGGTPVAMTTPTISELSAANMPGVYALLLDEDTTIAAGSDTEEMSLHITHASMTPVTRVVELFRPKITQGNTLDVTSTGAGGIDWGNVENQSTSVDLSATAINLCDTVTTNSDMRGTDNALLAASVPTNFSDLAITATTGLVSVGTNNDKTGYSISGTKTTLDALNDIAATDIVSAGAITTLSGAVVNVDTVDICTTNSDMRGTDNALLAASVPTNFADLDITATTGLVSINVNNDKTGYSISGTKTTLDDLNDIAAADIVSNGAINTLSGAVLVVATVSGTIACNMVQIDGNLNAAANLSDMFDGITGYTNGDAPATQDQLAALNDISTAEVNAQVVDVLKTDTISDLSVGTPPATPTFEEAVMHLYSALRNRLDVDLSGTPDYKTFYNDAGTLIWKKQVSDDGSTYTEAEGISG